MIIKAGINDYIIVSKLAHKLWPKHDLKELETEFKESLLNNKTAIFIYSDNGSYIGFVECSLRYDYVEGTTTPPVAYLEGIYVDDNYRKKGIARLLLKSCEEWGRNNKCSEFASDCELDNVVSLNFHLRAGFEEKNRLICFTKKI